MQKKVRGPSAVVPSTGITSGGVGPRQSTRASTQAASSSPQVARRGSSTSVAGGDAAGPRKGQLTPRNTQPQPKQRPHQSPSPQEAPTMCIPPAPATPEEIEVTVIAGYVDVVATTIAHGAKSLPPPPTTTLPVVVSNAAPHTACSPSTKTSRSTSPAPRNPLTSSEQEGGGARHPPLGDEEASSLLHNTPSSSNLFRHQRASLLEKVQLFGNGLLHWYGVLETKRLPPDVTLDALAHNVGVLSRDLNSALQECLVRCEGLLLRHPLVGGEERHTHHHSLQPRDSAGGRVSRTSSPHPLPSATRVGGGGGGARPSSATPFWTYYKQFFDVCFSSLGQLTSNAKLFVFMRQLIATRDGAKVEALLDELRQNQRRSVPALAGRRSSSDMLASVDPTRNPFVQWVETKWLPAMKEWESVIACAKREIETAGGGGGARQSDDPATTNEARMATTADRVVASVHRDLVSRSASLRELLQPGETVEELLHGTVETNLRALADHKAAQRKALDALRNAVETVNFVQLATCLREAGAFAAQLSNDKDRSLVATAQKLLVDVQHVAKATVAISLATKSRDAPMLVRALHTANSTMAMLRIYADETAMQRALSSGTEVVNALDSSATAGAPEDDRAGGLLSRLSGGSRMLRVEHVPSRAWAPELSVMYQAACALLDELLLTQRLEHQLHHFFNQAKLGGGGTVDEGEHEHDVKGGSCVTLEQLRHLVDQCRAVGIHGPLFTAAEQLLAREQSVRIKIHFDSRIRLVVLSEEASTRFENVRARIAAACPPPPTRGVSGEHASAIRIRYQDDDGDCVSLMDQGDWDALLSDIQGRCAYHQVTSPHHAAAPPSDGGSAVGSRKVEVFCDYPLLPMIQPPPATNSAPALHETKPATPLGGGGLKVGGGKFSASQHTAGALQNETLHVSGVGMQQAPPPARSAPSGGAQGPGRGADPQPPCAPTQSTNGPSPRRIVPSPEVEQDARRAQTSSNPTATTVRIGTENLSRWEAATAEALELLTIASQDTSQSARTSLAPAGDMVLPVGGGERGVGRREVGRWTDVSEVDATDIRTIASIETTRHPPAPNSGSGQTAQRPVSSPNTVTSPTTAAPSHREKSVMMLAQLRKQKEALERASKASQNQSRRLTTTDDGSTTHVRPQRK